MNTETPAPLGPLMRPDEAADYLGISVRSFWRNVANGSIPKPAKYFGRVTAIPRSEIDAVIAAAQNRAQLEGYREALGIAS